MQGKSRHCGTIAMTNALFVAFGYEPDYAGYDLKTRRLVIANELLNDPLAAFAGYPKIEYWAPSDGDFTGNVPVLGELSE